MKYSSQIIDVWYVPGNISGKYCYQSMSNDHIQLIRLPGGSSTNLDLLRVVRVYILSCLKIIRLTVELTWFQLRSLWKHSFSLPFFCYEKIISLIRRLYKFNLSMISILHKDMGDVLVNFRGFLSIFFSFDSKNRHSSREERKNPATQRNIKSQERFYIEIA